MRMEYDPEDVREVIKSVVVMVMSWGRRYFGL